MGFTVGSLFVPYYGFYIALGLIAASLVGVFQVRLFKKDLNTFIMAAATAGLGGIIGAKILYLIVSWRDIDLSKIADPAYFNSLMGGGFVFYGGLIGGALALFLFRRRLAEDLVSYLDICLQPFYVGWQNCLFLALHQREGSGICGADRYSEQGILCTAEP